jgi:hypothetical protein
MIAFSLNEACRRRVLVDVSNYLARTGYATARGSQAAGLRWRIARADRSRRIASLGAHLGGHRDLNELEVIGGGNLLVWQAAGNHHAIAYAEPRFSTAREFEIDPAVPVGNSDPAILMVQSAQNWHDYDVAAGLDGTRNWRVFV